METMRFQSGSEVFSYYAGSGMRFVRHERSGGRSGMRSRSVRCRLGPATRARCESSPPMSPIPRTCLRATNRRRSRWSAWSGHGDGDGSAQTVLTSTDVHCQPHPWRVQLRA